MKLEALQRAFVAAQAQPELAGQLFGGHAAGISAYANNCLFNRADALVEAYPTVTALVGESFMAGMARAYARQIPSRSGDLHRYGGQLAQFVDGFAPAADFPYLADVCRLDWACHRAYFAVDAPDIDLAALADIPAAQHEALRWQLAPAVALLESPWPLASLWLAHWAGQAFPALDQGGEQVLVWRDVDNRVQVRALRAGEFAWLAALARTEPLLHAQAAAQTAQADFELLPCLQWAVTQRVLAGFSLGTGE